MHPHNAVTKHHPFAISLAIFHKALPNLKRFQSFLLESMNQSNIANVAPFSPRSFVTKAQCGSCHPCGHVTSPMWLQQKRRVALSIPFAICHKPSVAPFSPSLSQVHACGYFQPMSQAQCGSFQHGMHVSQAQCVDTSSGKLSHH